MGSRIRELPGLRARSCRPVVQCISCRAPTYLVVDEMASQRGDERDVEMEGHLRSAYARGVDFISGAGLVFSRNPEKRHKESVQKRLAKAAPASEQLICMACRKLNVR